MSSSTAPQFPKDFVWGGAAAAYQIEGAKTADGKGLSVWDMLCDKPGAVYEGHSGATACEHYQRYEDDVRLFRELGLQAYRLSVSWPRVLPQGVGALNRAGLDFYSRLVDRLLEAHITPWVTLFHWDFPLVLYHRGGWLNRDSASWFADYAAVIADTLSDRVEHFFTLNEPQVYIGFGHQEGVHAPGVRLPLAEVLRAGHHTLLAHGLGVQALRAGARRPLSIGYAPVGMPRHPASASEADVAAARAATFSIFERNCWNNTWWMDPVYLGRYPEQGWEFYGADVPDVQPGDLETIAQPLDFFAVNIYQSQPYRAVPVGQGAIGQGAAGLGFEQVPFPTGYPRTAFNWPVTPESLYWGPRFFYERYAKPIVITENGLSCRDWVGLDGAVRDPQRIDFTRRYLREYHRAITDGVEARGYFHWSVMDNFEWAAGYRERFGLIHVDYETQARTVKDSGRWYRRVIESQGASLFDGSIS